MAGTLRAGPADVHGMLEPVAARYAAITQYSLRITAWRESDSLASGPAGRRAMQLSYLDANHFRYEASETVLVADGAFRWQYRAEGKEYLREPVGATDSKIAADFKRLHDQFVGRFRQLAELAPLTTFKGDQKMAGTKLVLPMFEIAPRSGEWMERLWVDPAQSLVAQSAFSPKLTPQGRGWLVHRFALQASADGAAFRFTPPAKARQVERFSHPPILGEPIPL